MIPPRRFNIFPLTEGCSEGLDVFIFFLRCILNVVITVYNMRDVIVL